MSNLRVGVIGAGFWARYQILAWKQIPGVDVTTISNRTTEKAHRLAEEIGIDTVTQSPEELVARRDVDVVDIITAESTHHQYTLLAADAGKHVICQKPMAQTMDECREMVTACSDAGVRLMIHDNWRRQTPIRRFLDWYHQKPVGSVRRARFGYLSSFPVFDMQPSLREAERFILMDMGTHIVDTARAFVGDLSWVVSRTDSVNEGIVGEDLATILAGTKSGCHCIIELSYASPTEHEHELETLIELECDQGTMQLGHDFRAVVTARDGHSTSMRFSPQAYEWVIPRYVLSMGSCLPANESFYRALTENVPSESEGSEYLNTMEAVFAAYESHETGKVIRLTTGG